MEYIKGLHKNKRLAKYEKEWWRYKQVVDILKSVTTSIFSIIICIALAEIILRSIGKTSAYVTANEMMQSDESTIWQLKPKSLFIFQNSNKEEIQITTNSIGIRDKEFEKGSNIMVLGDSFVQSSVVNLEDTFSKQLENQLRKNGISMNVWNFGQDGYSTFQDFALLNKYFSMVEPEIVILCFYMGNDIRDNFLHIPYYSFSSDAIDYKGFVGKGVKDFLRHSALVTNTYRLFQPYWIKWKNKNTFKTNGKVANSDNNVNINPVDYDQMEYYLYSNNHIPEIETGFDITERLFLAMKGFVEKRGKKFMVVFIPTKYQITGLLNKNWGSTPDNKFIDTPNKRLGEFCKKNKVKYADLTLALREAFSKGVPIFPFAGDKHWGKEGQGIASEVVAKQLL